MLISACFAYFTKMKPNNSNTKPEYLSIILDQGEGPIDGQCDRLQYNPSQWEFPRERLKLGKRLYFMAVRHKEMDFLNQI